MSVNRLYDTLFARLQQILPHESLPRVRNMAWLMTGIYLKSTVHLSSIANKIPGTAKLTSKVKRLTRFLQNRRVRVRNWYDLVAGKLLADIHAHGLEIRLVADGSKIGFGHQLLMVAVCYRRRAIPVVWTWVRGQRGHSSAVKQLALLAHIQALLPVGAQVMLVGDSEFGSGAVIRQLQTWQWRFVVRQQPNWLVESQDQWLRLDTLVAHPKQRCWLPNVHLMQKHVLAVNVWAYWAAGEKEPWLLATNLSTSTAVLLAYRRRMWIEEMFGDFKGHGFDLESSHLRHFLRLSRLTLAVALLYFLLVAFGAKTIKSGQRHLVDRNDRRDYSIFRIGCNMLERCLSNDKAFMLRFKLYHS